MTILALAVIFSIPIGMLINETIKGNIFDRNFYYGAEFPLLIIGILATTFLGVWILVSHQ